MSETKYTLKEIETIRRLIRNKILTGYYVPIKDDWEGCYYDASEAVQQTEEELRTILISGMSASSFIQSAVREKAARLKLLAHREKMREHKMEERMADKSLSGRDFLDYYQGFDEDKYFPLYVIELEYETKTFRVRLRQNGGFFGDKPVGYKTIAKNLPSFEEAERWATAHDCR